MPAKLLLDENLSVSVARTLCEMDGLDACHVRDRDMLGTRDAHVLDRAFVEDRVLCTANVNDFVRLARQRELHAGIVLIEDGSLHRDEQLAVLRAVVDFIASRDMANRVLWVAPEGTMELEDIPPA